MNQKLPIPDGILFDMDGVLADVRQSYRRAIEHTARSFGLDITNGDITREKLIGDANNDWVLTQRLLQKAGIRVSLKRVRTVFQEYYLGTANTRGFRWGEIMLVEKEFLSTLQKKTSLGVVTGRPRDEALWFLRRFDLQDLFPVVITMEDSEPKPDPGPVLMALSQMNIETAWMIGDTPDDMMAAHRAGVLGIGIGQADQADLLFNAGATVVLNHPHEISKIIS